MLYTHCIITRNEVACSNSNIQFHNWRVTPVNIPKIHSYSLYNKVICKGHTHIKHITSIRSPYSWPISKLLWDLVKKGPSHENGFLLHPDIRHLLTTLIRIIPCLGVETAQRALLQTRTETQQVPWAGFSGNRG